MRKLTVAGALILITLMSPFSAFAEEKISVAVAANFISAFKEMAADFEEKTKVKVEATFSSTGNLYSQIKNGAPYDLFLSADEERPDLLQKEGLTEGTFIYARGQAILWSADKDFCKAATWQDALKNNKIKKIAIANPLTAPYGAAAKKALQKAGLWDALQGKLVNARTLPSRFSMRARRRLMPDSVRFRLRSALKGKRGVSYNIPKRRKLFKSAVF